MADEAPDFISDEDAPDFLPDDHPAVAAAGSPENSSGTEPPDFIADKDAPDFIPDDKAGDESSAGGAFVRGAVKSVVPAAGGLAAAGYAGAAGAGFGTMVAGPVGGIVGGIVGGMAGALGGGYVVNGIQDYVLDKLGLKQGHGFFSDEQAQADQEQHPYAEFAGSLAPNLAAFSPTRAASLAQRAFAGAAFGGVEGAQEAYHGEFDPTKIAMAAAAGVAAPNPRGFTERAMDVAASKAPFAAGREQLAQYHADRATVDRANDVTMTARGTAQENMPPAEDPNVGDPQNKPGRSDSVYQKDNDTSTPPSVTQGDVAPDVTAAVTSGAPRATESMSDDELVSASRAQRDKVQDLAPTPATWEQAPGQRYKNPVLEGQVINRTLPVDGMAKLKGNAVFIDRRVPPSIDVGGKPLDPAVPLSIREHARADALKVQQSVAADQHLPPETVQRVAGEAADHYMNDWLTKNGYDPQEFAGKMGLEQKAPPEAAPVTSQTEATPVQKGADLSDNIQAAAEPKPAEEAPVTAAVTPEPAAPEARPHVIDMAVGEARKRGMEQIAQRLEAQPDADAATKLLAQFKAEGDRASKAKRAAKADSGVMARTVADRDRINRSLKAADEGFNRFQSPENVNPRDRAQVAQLKEQVKEALEHARIFNRGVLPHVSYKPMLGRGPNAVKAPPPSWVWSRAADMFVRGKMSAAEFVAQDRMLRSGNPEDASNVIMGNRVDADIAMGRRGGDDAIAAAEREGANSHVELVPAEDVAGKPQPIENAAALEKFQSGARDGPSGKPSEAINVDEMVRDFEAKNKGEQPEQVAAEDVTGKPEPIRTAEDLTKPTNLSDADIDKMIEQKGKENLPSWKDIAAQQQETAAERMARQRAAREAAGKAKETAGSGYEDEGKTFRPKTVVEMLRDQSGSVNLPTFKEVPRGAWRALFASKDPDAASMVRKWVAPETISALSKSAAALIRMGGGQTAQYLARAVYKVEQYRRVLNEGTEQDRINVMHAIDQGDKSLADPKFHPLIDVLEPMFKEMRERLEKLPTLAQQQFVENFFPHMWHNPLEGNAFVDNYFMKQGSGSSLHERSFPTIQEGLDAKLKLASTDPVEVTMRYLSSMHAYARSVEVLQKAVDAGVVKRFEDTSRGGASGNPHSTAIPKGWVPIEGRTLAAGEKLYAPEDWATVYNNSIDPGVRGKQLSKELYDGLQKTSNAVTSLELGLSAYHAFTMAKEAMITDMATGMSKLASGDLSGAKRMVAFAAAPVRLSMLGKKIQDIYLGKTENVPPEVQRVVDAMRDAGGRLMGSTHDPSYEYSRLGSFFSGWNPKKSWLPELKRGSLMNEYADVKQRIQDARNDKGGMALQGAKEIATGIGRVMQSAAQPLFEKYIPQVKAGAYYDTLHEWLLKNDGASPEELVAKAREIGDSVDNRFGEMVQDNVFAKRALKQAAQLGMRSWSWNLGTVREIGGGLISALQDPSRLSMGSKNYDPRVAYVAAMPAVVALTSMAYQFLKTGTMPGEAADLAVPKTGGENRYGTDERAILPGYEKDVFGWYDAPLHEAANKLATAPRLAVEAFTNSDYRGDPIYKENDPIGNRVLQYLQHVKDNVGPISIRQVFAGRDEGSNISKGEAAMAIRPAPAWLQNKEYIDAARNRHADRTWGMKQRHDAAEQARKE